MNIIAPPNRINPRTNEVQPAPDGVFKWSWAGRLRNGTLQKSYTQSTEIRTVDQLAAHVAEHFPGITFISGKQTLKPGGILRPMPPAALESPNVTAALRRRFKY